MMEVPVLGRIAAGTPIEALQNPTEVLPVADALLGSGEHFFAGVNLPELGYQPTARTATPNATHVVLTRQ